MKLRNKKTGEIKEVQPITIGGYRSLTELNEVWEDYKDDDLSKIIEWMDKGLEDEKLPPSVNDFVEKLKAWERLKEGGITFDLAHLSDETTITIFARKTGKIHDYDREIFLLFGGEE
jgi:hypothetical protein